MNRTEVTESIVAAKRRKKLSWAALAAIVGQSKEWSTAALLGQMTLTEAQLLDAIAIGQVTPGPVFTTATFIGYVVAGGWGAALATLGIFLPGFLLVAVTRPLIVRVRRSPLAGAFLDGVNVAALALMTVVTVKLAYSALVDVPTVLLALVSATAIIRFRVNTTWVVAGAAVVGAAVRAFR